MSDTKLDPLSQSVILTLSRNVSMNGRNLAEALEVPEEKLREKLAELVLAGRVKSSFYDQWRMA